MPRKRKRATGARRRHRSLSAPARRTRRRSRGLSAGITGIFANPIVGATVGAAAAGLVGGFLSKPGTGGKPFIESPVMRAALAGGVVFVLGKVMKAPAIGAGGVAVAAFGIIRNSNILGANFGLSESAQINYVTPALLSENPATLADAATLADYQGGYSATMY